ncbi:CBO2463/CBO2479 domain-containing protein [Clostridium sp. DL1XJH146]
MDRLKYISSEKFFEGIVVDVNDCSVTMDLKGRMGQLKVPRRLVITEYELLVGQEVGFMMSYPEVLGPDVDEDYAEIARREKEVKRKVEENK